MGHGGSPEEHQGGGQGPQRVETLAGQGHPPHEPQQGPTPHQADGGADQHL